MTGSWPDFADPSLGDADKERLAASEFLPWFEDGRRRGLIVWAMRTDGGGFAGVSGLMIPGPPVGGSHPEFGCLLAPAWHGRGFATEAGRAVLADGWSRLGLDRIITVLDTPNPVSRRLVDKLGFLFDEVRFDPDGRPYVVFVVDRDPAEARPRRPGGGSIGASATAAGPSARAG